MVGIAVDQTADWWEAQMGDKRAVSLDDSMVVSKAYNEVAEKAVRKAESWVS